MEPLRRHEKKGCMGRLSIQTEITPAHTPTSSLDQDQGAQFRDEPMDVTLSSAIPFSPDSDFEDALLEELTAPLSKPDKMPFGEQ